MNHLTPSNRGNTLSSDQCRADILDTHRPNKNHRHSHSSYLLSADLLGWAFSFVAGLIALLIYSGFNWPNFLMWWHSTGTSQLVGYCAFAIVATYTFMRRGHYIQRRPFWMETGEVLRRIMLFGLLYGVLVILAKMEMSRVLWLVSFGSAGVLVPYFRAQARHLLLRKGYWQKPSVIIGTDQQARDCYKALLSEPLLGFKVCAFIQSDLISASLEQPLPADLPLISWPAVALEELCQALDGYHIVFALSHETRHIYENWLEVLTQRFLDVHVAPPVSAVPVVSMEAQHFFSHDILLLRARNNLMDHRAQQLKRLLDLIGSTILILLTAPLTLLIVILIKLEGGPAFFGQTRVGIHGKHFTCYKFRTMKVNAEEELKAVLERDPVAAAEYKQFHKLKNDPRVTKTGVFLRKTSLDELPQIFNVFTGQMSLVGPRPRMPNEPSDFYYEAVRPGITGLWQVSGRNQLPFSQRIALDIWYVRNWNVWYDVAILFKTIRVVLLREGAY